MADSESQRLAMKDVFINFDQDGDGYITFEEAVHVLKEGGENIQPQTLKQFFNLIDKKHDGMVSFEELCTWLAYSDSAEMPPEQEAKLKVLNLMKKAKKTVKNMSEHFKDEDFGVDTHNLEVKIGTTQDSKTELDFKIFMGLEAEQRFELLSKNLETSDNLSLVIQFKSAQPETSKESILEALQIAKELVEAFIPKDIDMKALKIVGSTDGENVNIGIFFESPFFETLVDQFKSIFLTMIPNEFSASLAFEIKILKDLSDLIKEEVQGTNPQGKNIVLHLLEGALLKLEMKLTGQLLKSLRENYLSDKNVANLPESVKKVIVLLLMKGSNINLNLTHGELSYLEPFIGDSSNSFQNFVKFLKKQPLGRLLLMLPPLSLFTDIASEYLNGECIIGLKGPRVLAQLHAKTEGLKQLWDLLPKEG